MKGGKNMYTENEDYEVEVAESGGEVLVGDLIELGDDIVMAEELNKYPDALKFLVLGYCSYCNETIINRAIPMLDGLKPVQRRILYTMSTYKKTNLRKNKAVSQTIAGAVMSYHPHSDAPIYEAAVRMTENRGNMNMPLLLGKGNFGKSYSSKTASASRYTEVMLHPNADYYFEDIKGVNFVLNEKGDSHEPEILPVKFPSILVNPTQGVAVGIASSIPSFNILDVCNLVKEYIENGACSTVIYPDFNTGGYYIKDDKEIMRVMKKGKGKVKLRAKYTIEGKTISFTELPYGKYAEKIKEKINKLNISTVKDVKYLADRAGLLLTVECNNKNAVVPTLLRLFRDTDLESNYNANMTVIIDKKPEFLGVWGIIEEWVKFRRKVIHKKYQAEVDELQPKVRKLEAILEFLSLSKEELDEYIEVARYQGKSAAKKHVTEKFGDRYDSKEIGYMLAIPVSDLGNQAEYQSELDSVVAQINNYRDLMSDEAIDRSIVKDMDYFLGLFARKTRKTEITEKHLDYSSIEDGKEEDYVDDSDCVVLYKDGFIRKIHMLYTKTEDYAIKCKANDTLIAVDSKGRVLRIYLNQIPYCNFTDIGTYILQYCGIEGDDSEILSLDLLEEKEKTIIYSDGALGFLNYSEWVQNSRQVKVIEKGVSSRVEDAICDIIDTPEILLVRTRKGKIGYVATDTVTKKSRTARKLAFHVDSDDEIIGYYATELDNLPMILQNCAYYSAPDLAYLRSAEDLSEEVEWEYGYNL